MKQRRLLYKQWLYECYKVYEDYIELDTEQTENTKKRRKIESVENADLYKPVLNKIMTTHE